VRVNNLDVQVAGVLGPNFRLFLPPSINAAEQIDVWFPYAMSSTRQYRGIPIAGQLKPGIKLAQANAELQTLAAQFEREYPDSYCGHKGWQASPSDREPHGQLRLTARLLHDDVTREARPALFLLSCAVGFCTSDCMRKPGESDVGAGIGPDNVSWRSGRHLVRAESESFGNFLLKALCSRLCPPQSGCSARVFGLEAICRLGGSHIPLQSRIGDRRDRHPFRFGAGGGHQHVFWDCARMAYGIW